jgi:hypothetical protein
LLGYWFYGSLTILSYGDKPDNFNDNVPDIFATSLLPDVLKTGAISKPACIVLCGNSVAYGVEVNYFNGE